MPLPLIAHIDLDCFFVSVERIHDPSLIGKPVVVGGSAEGRGVVASASYEARKFGIHSAMPAARALRLCPGLIIVRGRHHEYSGYSRRLYERMLTITPVVERASIDEMYLDFTGCESLYGNDIPGYLPMLRKLIGDEFGLPCTIALASNKLVAKIATDTVKPAGTISVPHGSEEQFLAPLPINVIPGIGPKTGEVLRARGLNTVADLQSMSLRDLFHLFGAHGEWLYKAAHGRGSSSLSTDDGVKSISREETFPADISDRAELEVILHELTADVCSRLRARGGHARTVTLKLRTAAFLTCTRRKSIPPTDDDAVVFRITADLLSRLHEERMPVRLLGVGLSNFSDESQLEMDLIPESGRRERALRAIDELRDKFGDDSISIGSA